MKNLLIKLLKLLFRSQVKEDYVPKQPILKLRLDREWFSRECTIGSLYIDDKFECYILEDYDRLRFGQKKKYGETAIPAGTYEIVINYSPRFKKKLPLLKNVPGFTGIRIHAGNTATDTAGCLLPGRVKGVDRVGQSRLAFNALFKKLQQAKEAKKKILIKIEI